MDDIKREKEKGFDIDYMSDILEKKKEVGTKFQTPGFGLASQLFSVMAKHVIEKLGPEEGEELLKGAIEEFGYERGKRIAETAKAQGKPNSFKNWLIYTDIEATNFKPIVSMPDGDFLTKVKKCTFIKAAQDWGLEDYAKIYCKYVDYKILEGYNPDIQLILDDRHETGSSRCIFRYIMKEENKIEK